MTNDFDDIEDFEPEQKSKSQLKREAHALQAVGEELVNLSARKLAKIDMPQDLKEAVNLARKITAHGGRKRQLQFIGKLMRSIDYESIQHQLDRLRDDHKENVQQFHLVENWRDRLLSEGNEAVSEFVEQYPAVDIQQLRQLIRQAEKETRENKPPKSKRQLFQLISGVLTQA